MDDKYTDKQVCDILGDNHFSNLLQYVLHMFGTMPRSMTEEEIIQYLKMNKNIGIVFKFMPEEVKDWCRKYSKKLYWYDMDILVDCWSNGGFEKRLYDDKVYAISEDFKYENPEQIKDFDKIKFLRKDIKMTEQEIVAYLKENRTKGVAFGFMPVEVGDWIKANRKKLMGKLICFSDTFGWGAVNTDKPILSLDYIFALPEDFKPEEKPQENGWIEFDIDENECYRILDTDMRFHWSEWNKPLWIYEKDENRSWYLTNFGGYLYAGCNDWFMTPRIFYNNRLLDHYQKIEIDGKMVKPAIPVKIRFWKEIK